MASLIKIAKKLKRVDLEEIARQSFLENSEEALDKNIERLYNEGVDSKGQTLEDYAPFTIEIKKAKGQRYDHVTLQDEGDFVQGFFVKGNNFPFDFWSRDDKTKKIVKKYGKDIFGFRKKDSDDFTKEYTDREIISRFRESIKKIFG